MAHPLDDCRFNLAAASKKFDALHGDITQFGEDHPYTVKTSFDSSTGRHTLDFGEVSVEAREWGGVAGEIGDACRAALNYLVILLIRKAGREDDRNATFPIATSKTEYWRKGRGGIPYRDRVLGGIDEPLKKRIDDFQPYRDGDRAFRHPLALLNELNNASKHHTPPTAFQAIELPTHIVYLPTTERIENLTIQMTPEIGVEAKTTITGGLIMPGIVLYPKVKVEWSVGLDVVFGGNNPGVFLDLSDLASVIETCTTITESFAADLEAVI